MLTRLKSSNVFSKVVYIPNSRILVERKLKSFKMSFIFSNFVCRMSTTNAQRKMLFLTREFRGGSFREWFLQTSCQKAVWKILIHAFTGILPVFLEQNAVLSLARNIGKISFLTGIVLYAHLHRKYLSHIYTSQKLDFERFSRQSKKLDIYVQNDCLVYILTKT